MTHETRILIAMRPALYDELFAGAADQQLRALGQLSFPPAAEALTSAGLARAIGEQDVVLTGWGSPVFSEAVLAAADRLRLIAHAAGTIKQILPPAVFSHKARVTHAAAAMAIPVAETTLLFILMSLRQFHAIDRAFHEGGWPAARAFPLGGELAGQRIGIIGAGHTGRALIGRLQALGARLWVYDPYLSQAEAAALGVEKKELEPLLRGCPIVSLQAPATAATYRMLGAEQFAWLQDGAIFINTARAHLIDEAALLAELKTGRISAALDVFEQEPLPAASPFRGLPNVIMTPHIAAHTRPARQRQGQIISDEVARFLRTGALRYEVRRAMLATMA